jgi:hypothetical protein
MIIHACDRCGVPMAGPTDLTSLQNVVVPLASPASGEVTIDVGVQLAVQTPHDLCRPCLISALMELLLVRLEPAFTPALVTTIAARMVKQTKGVA